MSGPFTHTSREPRMWRGWLRNGHVIEVHWGLEPLGLQIGEADDDGDSFRRQLWIGLGFVQIFIPLWIIHVDGSWVREAPLWGVRADREKVWLTWGAWSKFLDWPWMLHTLAYQKETTDRKWVDVFHTNVEVNQEVHPYTYTLRDGTVQKRAATVSKRRHVLTYVGLRWIGWPRWIRESINVDFDAEVGERTGTWKGGCVGCGYDLRGGETMLDALRRMERERTFR